MAPRAVVFDLDGVLALPSVASALGRAEEELALPRGFLNEIFKKGDQNSSSFRLMRGEIMFSQWVSLVEEDYRKHAEDSGVSLPENFSVSHIFGQAISARKVNHSMLQAVLALKKKGFTTCILTNNWLDDSTQRSSLAQLMWDLRPHFDFLIESCRIGMAKPDPQIYKFMLDTLKASPNEVVFLDDIGANLKPARDLGMVTILVRDSDMALQELEKVTGVQLLKTEVAASLPIPCNPSDMSHGYVPIKPGVRLHFVEQGSGPAVCLCHGFPESWFSWRYQIPALAQAGFRVLAVDLKGYGESSAPPEIEEYSMETLCKDLVTFLDKLGILQAVFIGHDWGGMLVWSMALFYPERVRAVASLNTPFMPANPNVPLMEIIKANPVFSYQLYFQEPGVAEAELEEDLYRTFKLFFRANDEMELKTYNVCENGGLFVKSPKEPSLSRLVTEEDIRFYVQQFKKSGFRGPLNWYRNLDRNWKWGCQATGRKILIPALMVTAEKDRVLAPKMSKHMEDWIPHLKRGHIKDCGHWTQIEKPAELNQILVQWLETDARDPPVASKL
ncbi:bifunctional epoxide hydrolase 2 isoform X1 [Pipistrellus kuhlii]|uniref:Bifunctional epoxide hydrolase 2 n=1 Tax=Pipistrellus kuhlii TaxID=59472 RepID=A0A7J7XA04_PIPKU|nr:bifunctional epoxide hydrolase 2 isoform X1 [Pipistrellus kuhlii]KAF6346452.1 epoxide hydrolase 2 [Pipistrellus kuhlii]